MAKLARPHEDVRCDLERELGDRITSVIIDRAEQAAKLLGLKDRCIMLRARGDEGTLDAIEWRAS